MVERSDLVDAGPQWHSGPVTLGLDGYFRSARNLFASRSRADTPFDDTFSYTHAWLYGVELVATYAAGPVSAWGNIALARATGTGISAGRASLPPATVTYVTAHRVSLDTDQRLTASGGASWRLGALLLSGDVLVGSGTPRTPAGGMPNSARNPAYVTADLAAVIHIDLIEGLPTDLRIDLRNAFDRRVILTDRTAVGGGADGWNEPRGFYLGFEQSF